MPCTTHENPARGILDRARIAARRARTVDPEFAHRRSTAHHTAHRRRVAAAFATAYGVDVADLVLVDDPVRAEWHAVRVLLATIERTYQFLVLPGTCNVFLVLGPCPACGAEVPVAEASDLATFGHYLDADHPLPTPLEYAYDPGHRSDCQRDHRDE